MFSLMSDTDGGMRRIFKAKMKILLTALVEPVEPGDVILAHLGGLPEGHVAVRNGLHGGKVVLGERVPKESQELIRLCLMGNHLPTGILLFEMMLKSIFK